MERKNLKKDEPDNPNRIRSLYRWNSIFLSGLTILALLFALFVFFHLRTRGTDGFRKLYTDEQIHRVREEAEEKGRRDLLEKMQSALEDRETPDQVLREVFTDRIMVAGGGKYSFYPILENVEKSPFPAGSLRCADGKTVECGGTLPEADLVTGTLVSDDNGRIDWDRLAGSGIQEVSVLAGKLDAKGFSTDRQFERNCREAEKKGIPVSLCIEVNAPAKERVLSLAAEDVEALLARGGLPAGEGEGGSETETGSGASRETGADTLPASGQALAVLRIRSVEDLSEDGEDREKWTRTVSSLCRKLEGKGIRTAIGGSVLAFAAQLDLSQLADCDRWLIDYEPSVTFPYSICCWEYSREGRLDGVPGDSFLYVRIPAGEE